MRPATVNRELEEFGIIGPIVAADPALLLDHVRELVQDGTHADGHGSSCQASTTA